MTLHRGARGSHASRGMEDGPDATLTSAATPDDGDIAMANFPTLETRHDNAPGTPKAPTDEPMLTLASPRADIEADEATNELEQEQEQEQPQQTHQVEQNEEERSEQTQDEDPEAESSSDADQLVIDEEVKPKRRRKPPPAHAADGKRSARAAHEPEGARDEELRKRLSEQYIHSNPYFAESIFELTNHYNTTQVSEGIPKLSLKKVGNRYAKKVRARNGKPKAKLRDYAQYLGLQPTVQFKCSKCGSAGFESLQLLNEHLVNCTAVAPMAPPPAPSANSTNFKVTRKVFLCSACGTYYENWNLFLHMREVHKRFICLYCLGMFPHAEKLAGHLVNKHNCAPTQHADELAFAAAHREPCFLMCCDCQMVFTEQDYVTRHKCIGDDIKAAERVTVGGQDVQVTTNQLVIETSATKDGALSLTGTVELHSDNNKLVIGEEHEPAREPEAEIEAEPESKHEHEPEPEQENEHEHEHESESEREAMNTSAGKSELHDEQGEAPDVPDGAAVHEATAHDDRKVPKVTLKLSRTYDEAQGESPSSEGEDMEVDVTVAQSISQSQSDQDHEHENEHEQTCSQTYSQESEVDVEGNTSQEEPEIDQAASEEHSQEITATPETAESTKDFSQEEQDLLDVDIGEEVPLFPTAGSDVAINEIELDQPLDKFDIKLLLQKCLQATIPVCLYCNHARKIAVNGKQLGLHAIAEHRYSSIVKSITAEELIPESFNNRIQESLEELDGMHFTLVESGALFANDFECFQCRYTSPVHKELYMHNRKLHSKALVLCTMCKTSFYSYSELLCHLCPGVYSSERDRDVPFRCCMCVGEELPSAFRLMVHLRKKHHACDVCLELCDDQLRLSNHVWKHKLHHLCYRCGIAYRNKPDITKHLFWKHGTESVECKRCLQKKWPHVYHFCQPPASFACDECSESMTRASKLLVHKRLHAGEFPHACGEEGCAERFISKRLLAKHERKVHREPEEPVEVEEPEAEIVVDQEVAKEDAPEEKPELLAEAKLKDDKEEKPKKVDVYDLPELNLSESDSDSEDESSKSASIFKPDNDISSSMLLNPDDLLLENSQDDILKLADELDLSHASPEMDSAVLDIWNNFKTYQETIAKTEGSNDEDFLGILTDIPPVLTLEEALRDHDYCPRTTDTLIEQEPIPGLQASPTKSADHDYCDVPKEAEVELKMAAAAATATAESPQVAAPTKLKSKDSSDSSSDSDSSSCTCGSNCSCSSGSSSSSSSDSSESDSSSEEGRRRQQVRREKRRGRKPKPQQENLPPSVVRANLKNELKDEAKSSAAPAPAPKEAPIRDSDLSTTESDTDEEFYDKEPQKIANKLLAEKREKLMQLAAQGTYINGALIDSRPTTPSMPGEAGKAPKEAKRSKKSKSKKKKRKKSARKEAKLAALPPTPYRMQQQMAPLTLTLAKSTPTPPVYSPLNISNHIPMSNMMHTPAAQAPVLTDNENSGTRASKRRRVPNKFYGYSSDEENEKIVATGAPNIKFRKVDLPSPKPPLVVPPITIKTTPVVDPISIRMSTKPGEMRVQPLKLPFPKRRRAAASKKPRRAPPAKPPMAYAHARPQVMPLRVQFPLPHNARGRDDSGTDSNSSTSDAEEEPAPPPLPQPRALPKRPAAPPSAAAHGKPNATTTALYCYCRCPYDEVSEMIGCDSDECAIEWFHFECVNIMVPPKGQWFCPDCRKKKQQRREMLQHAQVK